MIIGCDLTQLDEFTKDLLTNHDIIEIDQDPLGKVATLKKKNPDETEIWTRPSLMARLQSACSIAVPEDKGCCPMVRPWSCRITASARSMARRQLRDSVLATASMFPVMAPLSSKLASRKKSNRSNKKKRA